MLPSYIISIQPDFFSMKYIRRGQGARTTKVLLLIFILYILESVVNLFLSSSNAKLIAKNNTIKP